MSGAKTFSTAPTSERMINNSEARGQRLRCLERAESTRDGAFQLYLVATGMSCPGAALFAMARCTVMVPFRSASPRERIEWRGRLLEAIPSLKEPRRAGDGPCTHQAGDLSLSRDVIEV